MTQDDLIKNLTEEYIEEKGFVTCEFTSSPDKIGDIFREIYKIRHLLVPLNAYWNVTVCKVCEGHHGGENYLHVEIKRDRT